MSGEWISPAGCENGGVTSFARVEVDLGALSDLCTPWCLHVAATLRIADHITAGVRTAPELATAAGADPDALDRLLTTNVNGVVRTIRAALPHMIARGDGDVLVTSSVSGHQAIYWEPVYSASKHALQAFVHGLRRQLVGTGVRAGAVAPGIVLNDLWGVSDPAEIAEKVARAEGIRSEDVADAVAYMLTRPRHVTIRDLVLLPRDQPI